MRRSWRCFDEFSGSAPPDLNLSRESGSFLRLCFLRGLFCGSGPGAKIFEIMLDGFQLQGNTCVIHCLLHSV